MTSLFFIIFLALTIFFAKKGKKHEESMKGKINYDEKVSGYTILAMFTGVISIVFLIWCIILIFIVGTEQTINAKISMYEEENTAIEESINDTVKNYMEFESKTYSDLKTEDAINLVSLFPELKADTLVQKQIELYISNNNSIKQLKEEKIDLSRAKWRLYFGK